MQSETSRGRPKKEADHSVLVGAVFNKEGNLLRRLVLGGHKTSRSPHPPALILKVYIEALTGFSHVSCPGILITTLPSQVRIFGGASEIREGKWNAHSKNKGRGEASPIAWVHLGYNQ